MSTIQLLKGMGVRTDLQPSISDHCRGLQRGTATGYGSRGKTLTGLGSDHHGGGITTISDCPSGLFVKCL